MINEETYLQLKKELAAIEKEKDQAVGRKKQIQEQLVKEFNIRTVVQAKKLLSKLKKEQKASEEKFEKEYRKFNKAYKSYRDQVSKRSK